MASKEALQKPAVPAVPLLVEDDDNANPAQLANGLMAAEPPLEPRNDAAQASPSRSTPEKEEPAPANLPPVQRSPFATASGSPSTSSNLGPQTPPQRHSEDSTGWGDSIQKINLDPGDKYCSVLPMDPGAVSPSSHMCIYCSQGQIKPSLLVLQNVYL